MAPRCSRYLSPPGMLPLSPADPCRLSSIHSLGASRARVGLGCLALLVGSMGYSSQAMAQTPQRTGLAEPVAASPGVAKPVAAAGATAAAEVTPTGMSIVERDRQAEALSQSMMSPFCPGRTLSACPSPKAAGWRADIRVWVGEGVSAEEIRRRLAARIPQHDLFGIPKTPLGWLLPIALVLAALTLLVGLLRVLIKPRALVEASRDVEPTDDKEKAAWEARLEQELDAIDQ